MTIAKPTSSPRSVQGQPAAVDVEVFSALVLGAIEELHIENGQTKENIAAIYRTIMGLRTSNDTLDILLFFTGYNEKLFLKAECADTPTDREMLLYVNRTVGDLLGCPPGQTEQKITGLLKLLHYVILLESGTLVQKEQVVMEIDSIDEQYRKMMLDDLMPGFVMPFQIPLQSKDADIRKSIEQLRSNPDNGILSKVLFRSEQNLSWTELEGIGPAEWTLFYQMNTERLTAFEQEFYACVDTILGELENDTKYDVKERIDTFMQPYKEVNFWQWSRE